MNRTGSVAGKVVGAVFLSLCLILAAALVLRALGVAFYAADQAGQVVEKTMSADSILYNYEYFKQQWQDIQAQDKKIVTAKQALEDFSKSAGPRENWDFRDKEESQRLQANLTGLHNVRAEMVAQYNARAKMANRSIFMGKDVPSQME